MAYVASVMEAKNVPSPQASAVVCDERLGKKGYVVQRVRRGQACLDMLFLLECTGSSASLECAPYSCPGLLTVHW